MVIGYIIFQKNLQQNDSKISLTRLAKTNAHSLRRHHFTSKFQHKFGERDPRTLLYPRCLLGGIQKCFAALSEETN